ncbi:MAG: hypothetical protein GY772_31435, partial [bacterium]|nr:hypothetical protein [bacterium]
RQYGPPPARRVGQSGNPDAPTADADTPHDIPLRRGADKIETPRTRSKRQRLRRGMHIDAQQAQSSGKSGVPDDDPGEPEGAENYYSDFYRGSLRNRRLAGYSFDEREALRAYYDPPSGWHGRLVRHCPACGEFCVDGATRCLRCSAWFLFGGTARANAVVSTLGITLRAAAAPVAANQMRDTADAARKRKVRDQAAVSIYGSTRQSSIRAEFRAHVRNGWKFSRKFFQLTPIWGTDFTDAQVLAHAQLGRSPYYPVNGVVHAWTPVKEYSDTTLNPYTYADTPDGRYAHLVELAVRDFTAQGLDETDFQAGANPESPFNKIVDKYLETAFGTKNPTTAHLLDKGMSQQRTVAPHRATEVLDARATARAMADELGIPSRLRRSNLGRQPRPPDTAAAGAASSSREVPATEAAPAERTSSKKPRARKRWAKRSTEIPATASPPEPPHQPPQQHRAASREFPAGPRSHQPPASPT